MFLKMLILNQCNIILFSKCCTSHGEQGYCPPGFETPKYFNESRREISQESTTTGYQVKNR